MTTNEVIPGLTSVKLVNSDTGEVAEYTVADVACARMLAAERQRTIWVSLVIERKKPNEGRAQHSASHILYRTVKACSAEIAHRTETGTNLYQ